MMETSIASAPTDDDFPPEPRGRCYTWPMQQFVYEAAPQTEPPPMCREPTVAQLLAATPSTSNMGPQLMPLGMPMPGQMALPPKKKRCRKKPADQLAQKKPNPWGEESYSDIIARALESAPEGRLKLNEIYQWFSDNIPYFRERSSQEEAAGWKNSIRHNLSLHSRFMRIQNEGAGKSSWWVINPDAKPGRNPRRARASTMDATSKAAIDKKRRGARKKVQDLRMGLHSGVPSLAGSTNSIVGHDIYDDESLQSGSFDPIFRSRAGSNMSVPGSTARVTPSMGDHPSAFEDFDFPPWVDSSVAAIPSDIVDRTDQMTLNSRSMVNGIKQEQKPVIKTEPVAPPSYHELNSVRGPSQLQNPLLRNHPLNKFPIAPAGLNLYPSYWPTPTVQVLQTPQSCAAQQSVSCSVGNALPIDLENLTLPDQPLMEMDVESLLRHELSQTRDHQINFDI
uniref:Forkhead box protein O n=1 Tax=Oscheius chongmingensis TaxID=486159 RepID=A0A3S8YYZ9_9BILA|nr:forkhead box protein O [Oscheius chongmingensis]